MNATPVSQNHRLGRGVTSRNVELFAAIGVGDAIQRSRAWLMFDSVCPFCTRAAKRVEPALKRRGVGVIPLQTGWVRSFLAARNEPLLKEIRFLTADGKLTGGADALVEVARRFWWAKPLVWIARIPAVRRWLQKGYEAIAARRHCAFSRRSRNRGVGRALLTYAPPFMLTVAALALRRELPNWLYMWTVAAALFFAAKWITVWKLLSKDATPPIKRLLAYSFLWPGLDAEAFCFGRAIDPPKARDVRAAIFKIAVGATLLWMAVGLADAASLVAGWLAMIGIILVLHFGILELLGQFWRARGINARPLMQAPAKATSISKLWSGRWNTAFTDLMHNEVFTPIAKRAGLIAAILGVFAVSGLLHELVISAPARGGYGLPTIYFGLQCAGVLIERSGFGARLGLGRGAVGRLFVMMVAAIPALMLFPPVFVHNVIVPMLESFKTL